MYSICIVSARFYPQVVGSGTSAYLLACRLAKNGHEVTVITDQALEELHHNQTFPFAVQYVHDLELYSVGKTSMQVPGVELYKQLVRNSPDLIQVCNFMPMFIISTFRELLSCPVVFMPFNTPIVKERTIGYYPIPELDVALAKFIIKSNAYDRVIAGSEAYLTSLISLGARTEAIQFSLLGVALDELQLAPATTEAEAFQKYFGDSLKPGEDYIILPSRITKQKGILDAIRALEIVNKKHKIKLVLTGMHNPFNIKYGDSVKELAKELLVHTKIISPLETIPRETLPIFYKASRVSIVPSLYEGLGLSAIESQALGVPLITSDTTGLNEIVTNGVNGLTSLPGDPKSLANNIKLLLEDQALARNLVINAHTTVKKFDISRHVTSLEITYKELLGGTR